LIEINKRTKLKRENVASIYPQSQKKKSTGDKGEESKDLTLGVVFISFLPDAGDKDE